MSDEIPRTLSYQTLHQSRPPNDRKGGLIAFGVITVALGALAGCMGLVTPLALLVPMPPGQPRMRVGALITAALFYFVGAVPVIWTGIGSMQRKRWVRPVVLAAAVPILVLGILTTIMTAIVFPKAVKAASNGSAPPAVLKMGLAFGLVMMVIGLVALPLAYILFYRSPHVRATLEFDDPHPRWTENCPIPVLGICLVLLAWGVTLVLSIPTAVMPAFGTVLHGPPAMFAFAMLGAVALVLARLTYLRRPAGWWGTLALLAIYTGGMAATNLRSDLVQLYGKAGYNELEKKAIEQFSGGGLTGAITAMVMFVIAGGYMLWVRRYYFALAEK